MYLPNKSQEGGGGANKLMSKDDLDVIIKY